MQTDTFEKTDSFITDLPDAITRAYYEIITDLLDQIADQFSEDYAQTFWEVEKETWQVWNEVTAAADTVTYDFLDTFDATFEALDRADRMDSKIAALIF